MTIGQEWHTIVKAFTLNDMPEEEKEALFKTQNEKDSSDTAKLKRYTCDAIKGNKEEFLKIYDQFKDAAKCEEQSIAVKNAIADGWGSEVHAADLLELKPTYFKDIKQVSDKLKGDHFEFFVTTLQPSDDDLQGTIAGYKSIKLEGGKFDKINRDMLKMIDNLERRVRAYNLFKQKSKL